MTFHRYTYEKVVKHGQYQGTIGVKNGRVKVEEFSHFCGTGTDGKGFDEYFEFCRRFKAALDEITFVEATSPAEL
jgi:hypothetical protein